MKENRIIFVLTASRGFFMLGYCLFSISTNISIYQFTESGLGIALLMAVKNIPVILIGVFAGTIVDNVKKSSIMIFTLLAQGILAILIMAQRTTVWILCIVSVYMIFYSFYKPAQSVIKPVLLNSKLLLNVNAIIMVVEELSTIVGSVLIASYFKNNTFILTMTSGVTLFMAGLILLIFVFPVEKKREHIALEQRKNKSQTNFWSETKQGWHYLISKDYLLVLSIAVALIWLSLGSFSSIQIIYLTKSLFLSEYYLGYSEAVISSGNILGYIMAPIIIKKVFFSSKREASLMGVGYICAGIALCMLIAINNVLIAFFGIFLYSLSYGFSNTIEETLEQTLPDKEYLGKTVSVISTIGTSGYLVGMIAAPLLTDIIHVNYVVFISSILTIITGLLIWGNKHKLTKERENE